MANRQQRRHPGKPQGMTYAQQLAQKKKQDEMWTELAKDTMLEVKSQIEVQRAMWLWVMAMNDAFGIGPDRFKQFADCVDRRAEWFETMKKDGDEEYASEKLRLEAEKVTGIDIQYLYEAEFRAAEARMREEDICDQNHSGGH